MSERLKSASLASASASSTSSAYRELGELFSVDAICDIDGERAKEVATKFGIPDSRHRSRRIA